MLLERAAVGFLTRRPASAADPFPTVPYWLAVRQGGVRDDVIALATARGIPGWFDAPLRIFHELPALLGSTSRRPLSGIERGLILRRLMAESSGSVLGGARRSEQFADALDRLVGDLAAEEITPAQWRAGLDSRGDRDDFERRRDAELVELYDRYIDTLARSGRRDGRDTWLDCTRALSADANTFGARLGGRRELRLFGLQDLRRGLKPLLQALAASPALDRIEIYSAETLDLGMPTEIIHLETNATSATRLFGVTTPEVGEPSDLSVQFIAAPDPVRELEEVARRVRALADAGTPLPRIAVVARQARPYLDLALSALDHFGVPATARRRVPLTDIPVVRAVRAFFAAAGDDWERHGLAELAEQPFFSSELNAGIINLVGFQHRVSGIEGWSAALEALLGESERQERRRVTGEAEERHRRSVPRSDEVRTAIDGFTRFTAVARKVDGPRSILAWLEWLEQFLADDPWQLRDQVDHVTHGRFDLVRLDRAGLEQLEAVIVEWKEALGALGASGEPVTAAEFVMELDRQLDLDVAQWTTVYRGVQVLEGFAAAYRSFDHLFMVGLEGNRFPVAAPTSPLLDDADVQSLVAAGLPLELRATWDHREQELFRVLVAGGQQSVTLSWSQLDASGREILRSGFVEALAEAVGENPETVGEKIPASRVLTPGARILRDDTAAAQAVHAVQIERTRERGTLSPWNGEITDAALLAWLAESYGEDRLWSPSQLESYAKCPWSWFSARLLRLEKLEDPEDALDAAVRGTMLHDALKRFYDAASVRVGGPVFLRDADLEWARPAMGLALDQTLAEEANGQLGHPTLRTAQRGELQRTLAHYLEFDVAYNESTYNNRTNASKRVRTAVASHELHFDDAVLDRDGFRIRYRGSIDRVEVGIDDRLSDDAGQYLAAIDYKSSKWGLPSKKDADPWVEGVLLQPALYAHALEQRFPGKIISRVEYRALNKWEIVFPLDLVNVKTKTGEISVNEENADRMGEALDAVVTHVQDIRAGHFSADPPPSCSCPSFCHAIDICRVAGGPRTANF